MTPKIEFHKPTQRWRYVDTKKFVSEKAVRHILHKNISENERLVSKLAEELIQGEIGLAEWEIETAKTLKTLHIQNYLLGTGGKKGLSQGDYGKIGNTLRREYQYLRGFSQDISDGKVSLAQFLARIKMYARKSRGSFEAGRVRSHINEGYQWEKRIRTKVESCPECIEYAAKGWVRIGTLPHPTEKCTCRANCGCYKEFAKTDPRDSLGLKKRLYVNLSTDFFK